MNKKGRSLSLNTIIIVFLSLIVLAILTSLFTNRIKTVENNEKYEPSFQVDFFENTKMFNKSDFPQECYVVCNSEIVFIFRVEMNEDAQIPFDPYVDGCNVSCKKLEVNK